MKSYALIIYIMFFVQSGAVSDGYPAGIRAIGLENKKPPAGGFFGRF